MKKSKSNGTILGCLILTACGGGGTASNPASPPMATSAAIGGMVSGFHSGVLLLSNAGAETIVVTANSNFAFTKPVAEGKTYNVTVLGQPSSIDCKVANGAGTVAHGIDSISNVNVICTDVAWTFVRFNVGVTVSGLLPGNSVIFLNNGNEALTVAENGLFVFPMEYITAAAYSGRAGGYDVTVKTGPANQSCTFSNGSGAVNPAEQNNFVNVIVSCK